MLFNSFEFQVFLLVVFLLYWFVSHGAAMAESDCGFGELYFLWLIPLLIPESKREITHQLPSDYMGEVDEQFKPVFQSFIKGVAYVNDTCFINRIRLRF